MKEDKPSPPAELDQQSPGTSGIWAVPSTSVPAWPPPAALPEQVGAGPQDWNSNGGFMGPEGRGESVQCRNTQKRVLKPVNLPHALLRLALESTGVRQRTQSCQLVSFWR